MGASNSFPAQEWGRVSVDKDGNVRLDEKILAGAPGLYPDQRIFSPFKLAQKGELDILGLFSADDPRNKGLYSDMLLVNYVGSSWFEAIIGNPNAYLLIAPAGWTSIQDGWVPSSWLVIIIDTQGRLVEHGQFEKLGDVAQLRDLLGSRWGGLPTWFRDSWETVFREDNPTWKLVTAPAGIIAEGFQFTRDAKTGAITALEGAFAAASKEFGEFKRGFTDPFGIKGGFFGATGNIMSAISSITKFIEKAAKSLTWVVPVAGGVLLLGVTVHIARKKRT